MIDNKSAGDLPAYTRRIDRAIEQHLSGAKPLSSSELNRLQYDIKRYQKQHANEKTALQEEKEKEQAANMSTWFQRAKEQAKRPSQ